MAYYECSGGNSGANGTLTAIFNVSVRASDWENGTSGGTSTKNGTATLSIIISDGSVTSKSLSGNVSLGVHTNTNSCTAQANLTISLSSVTWTPA